MTPDLLLLSLLEPTARMEEKTKWKGEEEEEREG
jgi:hypothetical protein